MLKFSYDISTWAQLIAIPTSVVVLVNITLIPTSNLFVILNKALLEN